MGLLVVEMIVDGHAYNLLKASLYIILELVMVIV
ncbi:unnamed protein product [Paramecium octaurelia]|uniref:Uncharacterized protein n=1 Tax=Paramecium octaurelia TaxID=43137 RepID=A0A8S1TYM4_PAROT|nr:unnamed protein product [Paramecium octaurelia]